MCVRECERACVRACVCMRECAVTGESVYVCMHAHTFCGGAVSTLSRPYRSHFLLGKKKTNIVVALSQVCGYI